VDKTNNYYIFIIIIICVQTNWIVPTKYLRTRVETTSFKHRADMNTIVWTERTKAIVQTKRKTIDTRKRMRSLSRPTEASRTRARATRITKKKNAAGKRLFSSLSQRNKANASSFLLRKSSLIILTWTILLSDKFVNEYWICIRHNNNNNNNNNDVLFVLWTYNLCVHRNAPVRVLKINNNEKHAKNLKTVSITIKKSNKGEFSQH